jgi:Ca2+-binding RTX toxin-like protein
MATVKADEKGFAKGTAGSDKVYGDAGENLLAGLAGNDTLWGRGGNDWLEAGAGNDKLYGDSGADVLNGGLGRDTMTGGAGADLFGFDTRPSNSSIDTITDFSVKYDTILLSKGIFKVPSAKSILSSSAFWTGAKAHDSNDRIIYNKSTGALYYDADGTGSKAAIQFAKLDKGLAMTYKDFGLL